MTSIAVAWLLETDWQRWLEIDRTMFLRRDQWLPQINKSVETWEARGVKTEKIIIDPDEHLAWCAERGEAVGTASRALHAATILHRRSNPA